MHRGPLGVENVALVHTDRAKVVEVYERLGFRLTPPGRYAVGHDAEWPVGLANHHALFRRGGYWELITIGDPELGGLGYEQLLDRRGVHLAKTTLRLSDVDAEVERLRSADVAVGDPIPIRRSLDVDGRTVHVDMKLVGYPPEWNAWLHSSLVHEDRDANYVPELLDHPNGVLAIEGVVVATADRLPTIERLSRFTGVEPNDDDVFELPDGTRIEVWPTGPADERFPLPASPATETLRAVIFSVESVDRLDAFLAEREVERRRVDGSIVVPASEAEGAHLVFEAWSRS